MNALARTAGTQLATPESQAAIRQSLKNSLYPGATDEGVSMVLAYCHAAALDPMTKPVHLVPMSVKKPGTRDQYEWRDVVMPGIELYRTKAHRTGEYAGQDDAEFGPTIDAAFGTVKVRYPEWCRVTVYRLVSGQRVPYSARVYWLESYATAGRNTDAPNAMWQKRPFGQLEKCAEALALRKGFPEAVGGQPTAEEMEGKVLDIDTAPPARQAIEMPRARTGATPAPTGTTEQGGSEPEGVIHEPAEGAAAQGEAGWHVTDSQKRMVMAKARIAGLTEEALLGRFHAVTRDNINEVLRELTEMANAGAE